MGKTKQVMTDKPYAVITGASQGLGKAFAIECAKRDMNLVLIALPGEGLHQTADAISKQFSVTAIPFETDLSLEDACFTIFDFVERKAVPVHLLINNAGVGLAANFENTTPAFCQLMVTVNVLSPVLLTRLFLPLLQQQPAAYILNVSSLANFFHIPGKEVYGASKSFLYSFSRSLNNSLRGTTVKVSVVCPGGINTNDRVRRANDTLKGIARNAIQSPEEVAAFALHRMLAGKTVIIPGNLNNLSLWISRCVPAYIKNRLIVKLTKRPSNLLTGNQ